MTVDVTEIETILGPLRGFDSDRTRMIALASIGGPTMKHPDLMKYRAQLQEIGLDCNSSDTFKYLMEGLYPIDLSQSVLDRVCLQPFSLESLLGSPRPYGSIEHHAILAVIAPNSD